MKLLTDYEAAEILRCSPSKIKRLRLTGKLPYIPGRPAFILEEDLTAYVETIRKLAAPKGPAEDRRESLDDARKWALKAKLLRRQRWPKSE